MSYVKHVIQPGERIVMVGHINWIVYWRAILCVILAVALLVLEWMLRQDIGPVPVGVTATILVLFGGAALLSAAGAWFVRWTTEIAVTDKRIIFKSGFIRRRTAEMNVDKVTTVDVIQSIWGRIFDYGSVHIHAAGGAGAIERLDRIAAPIALRNAIEVK